ncbi:MAG: hypothetical protein KC983_08460 [Phycisphaerales bacterium]|nr:hypothetical protein [Phycisphaerales bacterium]
MSSPQQFVILSSEPSTKTMAPIGTRAQLLKDLGRFNCAPERDGSNTLWGPGITMELPPEQDEITQMLLTITEDEIAWLTIVRLVKQFGWKLLDPMTGRELILPADRTTAAKS